MWIKRKERVFVEARAAEWKSEATHNESMCTTAASGAFNFCIHIIMQAFKFQTRII